MANRNWQSGGKLYSMHVNPVMLDLAFTVSNTSPTGITGLSGTGIQAVYMNSTAPGTDHVNPAPGVIEIRLQDPYTQALFSGKAIVSPSSGTPIAVTAAGALLTVGQIYTITLLGTTTTAEWHTLGLPAGITPVVGVSFIAAATGAGVGTGQVQAPATLGSGVITIESVRGNGVLIAPNPRANQGYGGLILHMCRDGAGAVVAPANGSAIVFTLYCGTSTVRVQGR